MESLQEVIKILSGEGGDELVQLIQDNKCDGQEMTDENGNQSFVRTNEAGDLIVGVMYRNKCHLDNSCGVNTE